jgi:hypothetical protein
MSKLTVTASSRIIILTGYNQTQRKTIKTSFLKGSYRLRFGFLCFSWLCCQAGGCLWAAGKRWLCLHKQVLTDDYRRMLKEHTAQTSVFKVFVRIGLSV